MKIAKRVFLFVATNILIIATLSIVMSVFGIQPYLDTKGINYQSKGSHKKKNEINV